jgi:hypothetical protein
MLVLFFWISIIVSIRFGIGSRAGLTNRLGRTHSFFCRFVGVGATMLKCVKPKRDYRFTKVEYLYRDYGNYKFWGEFWLDDIVSKSQLEPYLMEEMQFVPADVSVPSLTPSPSNDDDHWYHNITDVIPDCAISPGSLVLNKEKFMSQLRAAHQKDWFHICRWPQNCSFENSLS